MILIITKVVLVSLLGIALALLYLCQRANASKVGKLTVNDCKFEDLQFIDSSKIHFIGAAYAGRLYR